MRIAIFIIVGIVALAAGVSMTILWMVPDYSTHYTWQGY